MQGDFWHLFLAQFFMLFHMVALLLLSMVAFLTIFLLAENLQQPIRVFEIGGYWSCHGEQNASYHVKEDKNLYQKMVSKVTLHFVWGHLSRKQTVQRLLAQAEPQEVKDKNLSIMRSIFNSDLDFYLLFILLTNNFPTLSFGPISSVNTDFWTVPCGVPPNV